MEKTIGGGKIAKFVKVFSLNSFPLYGIQQGRVQRGGGGLRGLEHPPKVWHNSQLSSCMITIVTDKQQLVAKTNNKFTGLTLNGSVSSLQGLKQPSLTL